MLKRLRRAHPVGYCLLTEVVFLAVLMVVPVLLVLLLALLGVDLTRVDDYFLSAIQELLGALVAVFFLKKTDNLGCSAAGAPDFSMAFWWACSPLP